MGMVRFSGARETWTDGKQEFVERGPILINPNLVAGAYDNTILIAGNQIRVMEKLDEIEKKLAGGKNENKTGRRGTLPDKGARKGRRTRPEGKAWGFPSGWKVRHDRYRDTCGTAGRDGGIASEQERS